MLSKITVLTLQKELQHFMSNNVFWTKKIKTQQHQKKNKHNSYPESGIEPETSRTAVRCVNPTPLRQRNVSIKAKVFYCFNAIGRNINKQSNILF